MPTYVVLRRSCWWSAGAHADADRRGEAEMRRGDDVARIRSYVLEEHDGSIGSLCIYEAASPEAIRRHASAAELPVDEIVKVAGTVVVRPDLVPATQEP